MIKKQGITVTVMVVTIIILIILAGTITFSVYTTINYSTLSAWANEMMYIQDVVDEELNTSSGTDFTSGNVIIDISDADISEEQFEGETISEDNTVTLKILDLGKLRLTDTTYGNLETPNDIYAVSEETGKVYYVQGIDVDGLMYYSLTDSLKNRFGLSTITSKLTSVVFVPSVIGYTNVPIALTVKVPNTFTNIVISTSNDEIQIGSQLVKENTYEYSINANNITGNYTVTVSYNDGTQTLTSKYEVNGYDVTAPVIQELTDTNFVYKQTDSSRIEYLINLSATDESGIKVMKYAVGTITEEQAQEYFAINTNVITDGKINLNRPTTVYTIYVEDNAGNYSILTFDKSDYIISEDKVPAKWIANVTAIVDGVPIPKGFVASPYGANGDIKAENTKDGGLVIYELAENETEIPADETQFESWTERNQYVWVPVDDFTKFVRQDYINSTSKVIDENGIYNSLGKTDVYWEVMVDEKNLPLTTLAEQGSNYMSSTTLVEVQAMYASVKEYGGFYIARYEAGIDKQRTSSEETLITGDKVHSKMNKIPYNYIGWSTSTSMNIDTGAVVEVARGIYPNDSTNTTGVISALAYGVQWDATLEWYIDTGAMSIAQVNKSIGSTEFGNYTDHVINSKEDLNDGALVWDYSTSSSGSYVGKDSATLTYPKASGTKWVLSTGALKAANINNIYDMAGNMYEWTMEGFSTGGRINRGGDFGIYTYTGAGNPVAVRNIVTPSAGLRSYGFRFALYIKK
ncbi:MAG: hypothetical protein IJ272_01955 [Clostridia bacterium]|nr:hypothetical protein [Clostridia bacterium]